MIQTIFGGRLRAAFTRASDAAPAVARNCRRFMVISVPEHSRIMQRKQPCKIGSISLDCGKSQSAGSSSRFSQWEKEMLVGNLFSSIFLQANSLIDKHGWLQV